MKATVNSFHNAAMLHRIHRLYLSQDKTCT